MMPADEPWKGRVEEAVAGSDAALVRCVPKIVRQKPSSNLGEYARPILGAKFL